MILSGTVADRETFDEIDNFSSPPQKILNILESLKKSDGTLKGVLLLQKPLSMIWPHVR
jgi:hypothetical protein